MTNSLRLVGQLLGLTVTAIVMIGTWAPAAADPVSFKEEVFPILELRCLGCHQPGGDGYEKSGLDMRTYEGLMKGTNHGPMIIPGSIIESNLLAMIDRRTSSELWMPHGRKQLSKCERQAIRFWVAQGARNN
ncbi:MAG: c-type cytochrome domain-containing protein [Alphaproteobacteria bacterium]